MPGETESKVSVPERLDDDDGSVDSEALLRKLGWLNFQQLIDFSTAVMVYKPINSTAPPYLSECFTKSSAIHSHNTRSANRAFFPTYTNTKFGQKVLQKTEVVYEIIWIGTFNK